MVFEDGFFLAFASIYLGETIGLLFYLLICLPLSEHQLFLVLFAEDLFVLVLGKRLWLEGTLPTFLLADLLFDGGEVPNSLIFP